MGKLEKQVLKNEVKKIYEANARQVLKRNRITFSQFFKQYVKSKKQEQAGRIKTKAPAPFSFSCLRIFIRF